MAKQTKKRAKKYIEKWEKRCYNKGLPDEAPIEIRKMVPSYKEIAVCILNNDLNLNGLGFPVKKSKYYSMYKKIEIEKRNNKKPKT